MHLELIFVVVYMHAMYNSRKKPGILLTRSPAIYKRPERHCRPSHHHRRVPRSRQSASAPRCPRCRNYPRPDGIHLKQTWSQVYICKYIPSEFRSPLFGLYACKVSSSWTQLNHFEISTSVMRQVIGEHVSSLPSHWLTRSIGYVGAITQKWVLTVSIGTYRIASMQQLSWDLFSVRWLTLSRI